MAYDEAEPERQRCLLTWAIWSALRDRIILDGPHMQQIAEDAADRLYWAGGRIIEVEPSADELRHLQLDIIEAVNAIGVPVASPRVLEHRAELVSSDLLAHGWRRVAIAS